jgi:hypothetical protein
MNVKLNNLGIKTVLIIAISILINSQSFAQIKSYKAQYNFDYLNLDIGGTINGTTYLGAGFRTSIIGNLGLHGVLGINLPDSYDKALKKDVSNGNCSNCYSNRFHDGLSSGISISYVIPIAQNKFGVVPHIGFLYENFTRISKNNSKDFNKSSESEISINAGLDFYIKKFVLGLNVNPYGSRLRLGYVINDKPKEIKY